MTVAWGREDADDKLKCSPWFTIKKEISVPPLSTCCYPTAGNEANEAEELIDLRKAAARLQASLAAKGAGMNHEDALAIVRYARDRLREIGELHS